MPDIRTNNIELLHDAIKSQEDWDMILMLHNFFVAEGFVFKINPRGKITFSYKGRKEFLLWRDSSIKVRLLNLNEYHDKIIQCTEPVRNTILYALECHDCENKCNTQIHFEYDGVKYRKCHPQKWWINFVFSNPAKDDIQSLIELVKLELPYYK